ncbi:hypothetical protein JO972_07840 [Verrucomicrobiaceae bacterium 5K15]|uniref:Uncharacterized protein n=1 Tax=Oceaniferula flava TaxID=2800421 RepID=A0AAE2SDA2_9BACT|nr:hypothetical protein [Oceaniferula flavus]MBK1854867.1 hypothetical protein [Oceaniferula flavus]MBM1136173.1 hypothetical protein [Oceaniferula flavus]
MEYLSRSTILPLALSATAILSQCGPSQLKSGPATPEIASQHVTKLRTYDSPGRSSEIISYAKHHGLLLATNSVAEEIQVMRLPNPGAANPQPLDMDASSPGIQGIQLGGEPTSVSAHPTQPYALSAVNGEQGRLVVIDLNAAARGQQKVVIDQKIGIQLDSIGVAPNGRWVVVADEAEGDGSTPGNILVAPISGNLGNGKSLAFRKVPGLAAALGRPAGRVEPEFIAIDPTSRFAAVSCQEDNAIALVRLSNSPSLGGVIRLPRNAQPDGVHLISHGSQTILAIAEEGTDSASFYQVSANNLSQPKLLARVNIRSLGGMGTRSDPEGVALFRQGGHLYCAIGIERANRVVIMNLDQPTAPVKEAIVSVGSRPEDVIAIRTGSTTTVLSADEGKPGRGEISFIRVQ